MKKIVHLRIKKRLGPVQIAGATRATGLDRSRRAGALPPEPAHPRRREDRRTGPSLRARLSGSLIHVDVKKLGNIPDGGGWRFVGRVQGDQNRLITEHGRRNKRYQPLIGHAFVHTVIDDHSRVAYAEIHDDETAATAVESPTSGVVVRRPLGIRVERVLSDNGPAYKSHAWRDTCANLIPEKTRPYRAANQRQN